MAPFVIYMKRIILVVLLQQIPAMTLHAQVQNKAAAPQSPGTKNAKDSFGYAAG